MAGIALCAGNKVGCAFPCCRSAVMAADAASYYRRMVDNCVAPSGRGMAGIATIGAVDMCGVLARRGRAVMTARAGARYRGMVEARQCPCSGGMAGIALCCGDDVCGMFAGGGAAVMATAARSHYFGVINTADRVPGARGMASVAVVAAIDMSCALAGGSAPIMARHTGSGHAGVIEACICPVACDMASIATAAGDEVCGGLTRGDCAVMTVGATSHHIVMVYSGSGCPRRSNMTAVTRVAAEYVVIGFMACSDQGPGLMASGALRRRSFENSAIMAAFAVNARMTAGQGESSR